MTSDNHTKESVPEETAAPVIPPPEFSFELKVPRDRVGVLVGTKGKIKRRIESQTKTKLTVDSKEGIVTITADDGLRIFIAKEVVRAIARGFNPDLALLLLKPDYLLEVISLADASRNKNDQARLKGRIIGEQGKSRHFIEQMTGAYVMVYGKTVAIVGEVEQVTAARKAVEMIIQGSPHRNVYKWLERHKRRAAQQEFMQ